MPPWAATPGGDGQSVSLPVVGSDLINAATAQGGNGGKGGNGNLNDGYGGTYSGFSGGGGAGGGATAQAETHAAAGDTSATSTGNGGNGGAGGSYDSRVAVGVNGVGGAGGNAAATSLAEALSGAATASANANGGSGALPGTTLPPYSDPLEYFLDEPGGAGGGARASATATSTSAATASAKALGGGAGYGTDGPAQSGGSAEAHATASTSGSADATATADAEGGYGNGFSGGSVGGGAVATASASSAGGNATASARQVNGASAYGRMRGPRVSDGVIAGTAGTDSSMTDAVSGSAGGKLTLIQQAIAGDGGASTDGGSAQSVLHASNPGGGELFAEVLAQGGSTPSSDGQAPPQYSTGRGGGADAEVFATGPNAKRVEAHAVAQNGAGFVDYYYGGTNGSKNVSALASAQGLGEVVARAEASAPAGGHYSSESDAASVGAVSGAHTLLTLSGSPFGPPGSPTPYIYSSLVRAAQTRATLGSAAGPAGAALPSVGVRQSFLFGAPGAGDVDAWSAGHPNSQAALAGANTLALGELAADAESNDAVHLTSSFEVDLDGRSFSEPTHLGLAFLDPTARAGSVQILQLHFSVDGRDVFDTSFSSTDAALAGLHDTVVDLGSLGVVGSLRKLVLSVDLDFAQISQEVGFASTFALYATAPEPGAAALLACALAILALRELKSGSRMR